MVEVVKISVPVAEKKPLIGSACATEAALKAKANNAMKRLIIGVSGFTNLNSRAGSKVFSKRAYLPVRKHLCSGPLPGANQKQQIVLTEQKPMEAFRPAQSPPNDIKQAGYV